VADGFNLPISTETKFDLIHLDSVLHHLIGRNRNQSLSLVKRLLALVEEKLTEDGVMVIDEMYCESSCIIPHLLPM
jgi:hypothetical protein